MRTYDISRPPELINIGFDGENKWRPRGFNCTNWLQKHPDGIITLWIQPEGVRKAFPVSTTKIENTIVWYPLSEELYPGTGKLQLIIQDGEFIGKSDTIKFEVNKSLVSGGAHPDSQPSWATQIIQDVTEQVNRAEAAVSHYPQIVNGVWFVWDATQSEFVSTGINAQGEDGVSPTVTVTAIEGGHRVTITDASGGHVFDVMDGESGSGFGSIVYVTIGEDGKASMSASEILAAVDAGKFPILKMLGVNVPYITNDDTGYNKPVFGLSAIGGNNSRIDAIAVTVKEDKTCSLELVESPTKTSDLTNDSGFVTAQQAAASAPVQSVNGKTGTVVLGASDVGALPDDTPIPAEVTEQTVAGWGFTKNTGTYSKPSGGIPKSDLASAVQTSLGKADTALQTAPVTSVNNKTGAVTVKTPYYLTVTTENDTVYVDKTPAEIDALSAAGYDVHIRYPYEGEVLDARFNTLIETEALFGVAAGYDILSVFVLADRTVSSYVLDIQNELSQKADKSDIPAMATAPNMSDWTSGKTVDAATMKTVVTSAGLKVSALENDVSELARGKANTSDIPTAVSELTNDSGYQTAQDVQTAIANLQSKAITDTGGYYTADTVEGALQEIGAELAGVNTLIGSGVIT